MTFISVDVREYEVLKLKEKELKKQIEELGKSITVFMDQEGSDETPVLPMGGKIQLLYKENWEYPEDVTALKEKLAEAEHRARLNGTAKGTKNPYIKYLPPRP